MKFSDMYKKRDENKFKEKKFIFRKESIDDGIGKIKDDSKSKEDKTTIDNKANLKRILFISPSLAERICILKNASEINVSFYTCSHINELNTNRSDLNLVFDAIIISDEALEKVDMLSASNYIHLIKEKYGRINIKPPKIVLLTDFKQRFETKCLHLNIDCVPDFLYKKIFKRENIEQIIKNLEESK
ncbi:MAG: hypothetical protein QXO35_03130 [Candidatus Micrarchaeia archaeon]